jgi:SAM-dependent methyltransferase
MDDLHSKSPFSVGAKTKRIVSYDHSVSSDGGLVRLPVDNFICLESGIVFNASGLRRNSDSFYADQYDLHSESAFAEFQYFDRAGARGIYTSILEFILSTNRIDLTGDVLDIGCGKGMLLRQFASQRPKWTMSAIEPSRNARRFFAQVMPNVSVFEGKFEDSPFIDREFNLVMANGVLEHVSDPVGFLTSFRNCISPYGVGYIGVPNFANNPSDLFTYDHLTRFVPSTIRAVFSRVGLEIIAQSCPADRVPMWFLVSRTSPRPGWANAGDRQLHGAIEAKRFIDKMLASYREASEEARRHDQRLTVYGTGLLLPFAISQGVLASEEINAIVDDNSTLWGSRKWGVEVYGPHSWPALDVKHLVFAANPCYLQSMVQKASTALGDDGKLYIPRL